MLADFFASMSSMLSLSPGLAIAGSFLWGIAGILLSPCHLAGIPLIVGYIDSQGEVKTGRAALVSTLFSLGILVTIAVIGIATGLAGRMMGDIGKAGNIIVAFIMVVMGLHLLEMIRLPFPENGISQPGMKQRGLGAAFILGLFFGLALGPCSFAYMAPVLGVAFSAASENFIWSVALVAAYGAGHCLVIIIAGSSVKFVKGMLDWNEKAEGAGLIKKICGSLVVAAGLYMIATAW